MSRCSKSRTEGKELSREQSAELVPHPSYPAKYIYMQIQLCTTTYLQEYIPIIRPNTYTYNYIHMQIKIHPYRNTPLLSAQIHPHTTTSTCKYNYVQICPNRNTSLLSTQIYLHTSTCKYKYIKLEIHPSYHLSGQVPPYIFFMNKLPLHKAYILNR